MIIDAIQQTSALLPNKISHVNAADILSLERRNNNNNNDNNEMTW